MREEEPAPIDKESKEKEQPHEGLIERANKQENTNVVVEQASQLKAQSVDREVQPDLTDEETDEDDAESTDNESVDEENTPTKKSLYTKLTEFLIGSSPPEIGATTTVQQKTPAKRRRKSKNDSQMHGFATPKQGNDALRKILEDDDEATADTSWEGQETDNNIIEIPAIDHANMDN